MVSIHRAKDAIALADGIASEMRTNRRSLGFTGVDGYGQKSVEVLDFAGI
jgi:hypothetical protein